MIKSANRTILDIAIYIKTRYNNKILPSHYMRECLNIGIILYNDIFKHISVSEFDCISFFRPPPSTISTTTVSNHSTIPPPQDQRDREVIKQRSIFEKKNKKNYRVALHILVTPILFKELSLD